MRNTENRKCALALQRGQRIFDRSRNFWRVRRHLRLKTRDDLTVRPDQKLREIPLNVAASLGIDSFVRQVLIERSLIIALHGNLGHHREGYAVLRLAKGLDLLIRSRFLGPKIVRRNPYYHKAAILVLLINRFERRVLRSKTA